MSIGTFFSKNKGIIIFLVMFGTAIGLYFLLKTSPLPPSPSGSCTNTQTSYTCGKVATCIDNCPSGLAFCGDPCNKLCYDSKVNQCVNNKVCKLDSVCYQNGIETDCCTTLVPNCIASTGLCDNCSSKNTEFCLEPTGGKCCAVGDTCCKGVDDTVGVCCGSESTCLSVPNSTKKICCPVKSTVVSNGTCCDKDQIITIDNITTCCPYAICYDPSTGLKTCCDSDQGCQTTSICLDSTIYSHAPLDVQGSCLISPVSFSPTETDSLSKLVCQNPSKFIDSSLTECTTSTDCDSSEVCTSLYYRKLPNGQQCTDDSQCTGFGSQGVAQNCYITKDDGTVTIIDCPTSGDYRGILREGTCSLRCPVQQNGKSIWCPPGDTCVSFTDTGGDLTGAFCKNNKCTGGGPILNSPDLIDAKRVCKQQYQIGVTDLCTYYNTVTGETFTRPPDIDVDTATTTYWCDFSYKGSTDGIQGNLIPSSTNLTFPDQVVGTYAGYGNAHFLSFQEGTLDSASNLKVLGQAVQRWPSGTTQNSGIRTTSNVATTMQGVCNATDCYNRVNEKGLGYVSFDGSKCTGRFLCSGANSVLPVSPDPIPYSNFTNVCQDVNGWNGLACPENYNCQYAPFSSTDGAVLPEEAGIFTCISSLQKINY